VGAALPPGPSFVGGVHLVIWAHVNPRIESAAIDLIRYLSAPPIQTEFARRTGLLPARLEVLQQPPFTTDPRLQVLVKAMAGGRSHAGIPSWGLVEERLSTALTAIWSSLKQDPQQDLDALISAQLEPLADRLDMLLSR
jgi:multiple sugar transport system substrate-binding protein